MKLLYLRGLETSPSAAPLTTAVTAVSTAIAAATTTTAAALVHVVWRSTVVAILLIPCGATAVALLAITAKVLVTPASPLVATSAVTTTAAAALATSPSPLTIIPWVRVVPTSLVVSIATCNFEIRRFLYKLKICDGF